jgi:hypothetical protein
MNKTICWLECGRLFTGGRFLLTVLHSAPYQPKANDLFSIACLQYFYTCLGGIADTNGVPRFWPFFIQGKGTSGYVLDLVLDS